MKRGLVVLLLGLLLLAPIVFAEENGSGNVSKLKGVLDVAKNIPSEESILNREIEIPGIFALFLGIGDSNSIDLAHLIVLVGVFIMILVLLYAIVEFIPFFGKRATRFFATLIILLLIGITGSLNYLVDFLWDISKLFGLIESFGWLKIIVALAISFAAIWLLRKIAMWIFQNYRKNIGRAEGDIIHTAEEVASVHAESLENE